MNIVHVMSLIVKVVIKCEYHVLYKPNDGIHSEAPASKSPKPCVQ